MAAAVAPSIRPLTTDDAPALADLIRCAFAAQSLATDPPSSALRETAASIADALARGGGAGVAAGGALVAAVIWQERDDGLYFGRLSVDPAWRGRGFARRLVAAAEAEAARRGLARVHLKVRLALADNRRLFATCGYREGALETHPGFAAPTTVVLEKVLPRAAPRHAGGEPRPNAA